MDAIADFLDFWCIYPRRQAKLDAQKAWGKMDADKRKKAIEMLPEHCKRWDDPQYIPLAASWLRGERFEDEFPADVQKTVPWWTTDQATLAYGNQKSMRPRPGESMGDYRARLRAA